MTILLVNTDTADEKETYTIDDSLLDQSKPEHKQLYDSIQDARFTSFKETELPDTELGWEAIGCLCEIKVTTKPITIEDEITLILG